MELALPAKRFSSTAYYVYGSVIPLIENGINYNKINEIDVLSFFRCITEPAQ